MRNQRTASKERRRGNLYRAMFIVVCVLFIGSFVQVYL